MATLLTARAAVLSTRRRAIPAIVIGGVIAGVVDLVYPILLYSPRAPILIPQTIASGILGVRSYSGGAATAALGVGLHFLIALSAAAVYFLLSRRFPFLVERAVVGGLIYGVAVYAFMHAVVVPLSLVPPHATPPIRRACEIVEHALGIGLPIALSVRHFSR